MATAVVVSATTALKEKETTEELNKTQEIKTEEEAPAPPATESVVEQPKEATNGDASVEQSTVAEQPKEAINGDASVEQSTPEAEAPAKVVNKEEVVEETKAAAEEPAEEKTDKKAEAEAPEPASEVAPKPVEKVEPKPEPVAGETRENTDSGEAAVEAPLEKTTAKEEKPVEAEVKASTDDVTVEKTEE